MDKRDKKELITFQSKISRELVEDLVLIMNREGKTRRRLLEEFIQWCKYEHANKRSLFDIGSKEL